MDMINIETNTILNNAPSPFEFYECLKPTPLFFACPHSGRYYPPELTNASELTLSNLRESEDAFTDILCSGLPAKGAHLICANFARSYIDLNRNPQILDYKIINGASPNSCAITNSGFGIIPRIVGIGREIYREKISLEAATKRITNIYEPYHQKIHGKLNVLKNEFGRAYLFDIHSMPSSALGSLSADIILGDRFGSSCSPKTLELVEAHFKSAGLTVRRNHPFAGGYTTIKYGAPKQQIEALQIEINRSLYMNESNLELIDAHKEIKDIIGALVETAFVGTIEN